MNERQFRDGFLTIAGRGKSSGDRKSIVFHCWFTGEKGVGRLAARKLARKIVVDTQPYIIGSRRRRRSDLRGDA